MKAHLFSHNDLDGLSVYFPLKLAYGENLVTTKFCSYKMVNVLLKKFLKTCNYTDSIFITDITLNEECISLLHKRSLKGQPIYFIDHHECNLPLNKYNWVHVTTVYKDGRQACATSLLTEFLMDKGLIKKHEVLSSYVEYVRLYDTWEWEEHNCKYAKNINDIFFMNSFKEFLDIIYPIILENSEGSFSFPSKYNFLLEVENKRIEKYIEAKDKEMRKTVIEGRPVGIVYAESYQSEVGSYLAKNHLDLDFIILVNLSSRRVSVRSFKDEADSNEFCSLFDGGGHKKASGFSLTKENIFQFIHM